MKQLLRRIVGWAGQDTSRANAAQASVRLMHRRRQVADVDAYLGEHLHDRGRPSPVRPAARRQR